jgi:hypothetical protein
MLIRMLFVQVLHSFENLSSGPHHNPVEVGHDLSPTAEIDLSSRRFHFAKSPLISHTELPVPVVHIFT